MAALPPLHKELIKKSSFPVCACFCFDCYCGRYSAGYGCCRRKGLSVHRTLSLISRLRLLLLLHKRRSRRKKRVLAFIEAHTPLRLGPFCSFRRRVSLPTSRWIGSERRHYAPVTVLLLNSVSVWGAGKLAEGIRCSKACHPMLLQKRPDGNSLLPTCQSSCQCTGLAAFTKEL